MRAQQEVGRHHDGRQHVVEIMRDAAGELADRLHLLRLRELVLQRAPFGGLQRVHDGGFGVALFFLFDGRDDSRKYQEEWSIMFKRWIKEFCKHENFTRAVLELTVFYPDDYTPQMAGMRLSAFITKFFEVKIDPQKGIIKKSVA